MANSAAATLAAIAGSRDRIVEACATLDEPDWHHATLLPGWDVQDVVAHLGSLEGLLLGDPEPAHEVAEREHVRNPLGALNERLVDRRRSWTGAAVLAEFRETSGRRLEELAALDETALDGEVMSPNGRMVPLRDFLGIRLWDFLTHELDVCMALGVPFQQDSAAARRVLAEMLQLLPRAAAKGGVPEGTTVDVEIRQPVHMRAAATVVDGRGVVAEPGESGDAALRLVADPQAFLLVATGRRDPGEALTGGGIVVTGATDLAERCLAAMNVVP